MKCTNLLFTLAFAALMLLHKKTFALDGAYQSHDPSALIKNGSRYYMFTTGDGIYAAYSDDLFRWTSSPKTVFPIGTWPSWINSAVPGFNGNFWAPDCVYMNGKYYLYYSCSTFGSSVSAIGVATSPTLDPNSTSYKWTDLGMVVSSSKNTDINAIDPAIFRDSNGRLFMSYGSFFGGIGLVELDPATGKVKSGATVTRIAGGSNADWEAPYIIKEGSYYYLFVNRGYCCRGTNSTYKIVMGRSTSVFGPYLDRNGVDLKNGGGTTVLATSGKYIGPGHFGLLRENGSNFVSLHYYDGNDNGNAKLDIVNMGFSSGWPFITRDWVASGRYRVTNKHSNLVWDAWGCTGALGQAIAQGTWSGALCQQWNFTPLGNGEYRIASAQTGRVADVVNCNPNNGAKLQLYDWLNNNCQKFKIERLADGSHVFTSLTGTRVVEVPNASTTAGTQLSLYNYTGCNCQKWSITSATTSSQASSVDMGTEVSVVPGVEKINGSGSSLSYSIYPNPAVGGSFTIELNELPVAKGVTLEIHDGSGRVVYRKSVAGQKRIPVSVPLSAGMYLVRISAGAEQKWNKLVIE